MRADDPRHGTEAGCREHYRQGVEPCAPCLRAHRIANTLRRLYPHKTSALGSQRRIQALQAIGYSRDRIAHELGYSDGGAITYLMKADTMLIVTASRIREVYDRLSMHIPQGAGATRARTWAKRHGYPPPLAWDNIDDPDERPTPGYEPRDLSDVRIADEYDEAVVLRCLGGDGAVAACATVAERIEVCRRWVESGRSINSLEGLTGWRGSRYYRQGAAA